MDARIRNFFPFLNSETTLKAVNRKAGSRFALDNAASTQLSLPVLEALLNASFNYANVHRGFYDASVQSGIAMERAYNTAANLVNAASWQEIVLGTNTTGMINLVAQGLRSQFEDGDNIVLTELEHSSNVGPWLGLKDTLLKGRAPVKVELKYARFDLSTGELDYDHLRSLINAKTRVVSVIGASNFLGVKPDIAKVAQMARESGHVRPDGTKGSIYMVDGAQLVPSTHVDVQKIGCDFLAWSSHKMAIPLGLGSLYARKAVLEMLDHPLHGGGMYTDLFMDRECWREHPWDFTAGTPPILNIIAFDAGMKFLINAGLGNYPLEAGLQHSEAVERAGRALVTEQLLSRPRGGFPHPYAIPDELAPLWQEFIGKHPEITSRLVAGDAPNQTVKTAMNNITLYLKELTALALEGLKKIPGITIYGPLEAEKRGCLVAFNIKGMAATDVGVALSRYGVETRCGHHCVYFGHERYGIKSTGSVRLSFYIYNTPEEIAYALEAVEKIAALP
jgi:cysteine desulfurase/selenocysteine lyase